MSKLHSPCPEELLDGNSFFWKIYKFDEKVCTLSNKNRISAGRLKQSCQNIFFLCPGKPWRKTSLPGKIIFFFNFFGLWAQEKSDFCLELLARVPELNSLSPQEKFDQNLIFLKKTKFLFINADLQIEPFIFWLSNFCRLVKSPTHVSIETCFPKMQFFFQKFIIFFLQFQFWLKQFGVSGTIAESFSNFFLRVHINHSWSYCINEKRVTFFLTILELERQDFGLLRF